VEPLASLSWIGTPLLLGVTVLRALGIARRSDPLAYWGWAWTIGAFGTGLVVLAWLSTGPEVGSALVPVTAVLVLTLVVHLAGRRTRIEVAPAPASSWSPGETWVFRAALAFVLCVVAERILDGTLVGIVLTDEGNVWSFRSKMLFHTGGFGDAYRAAEETYSLGNRDYPLWNPMLQVWTFAHAGHVTHVLNRVPLQLFSVALILIMAGGLRRGAHPLVAAVLLVLLSDMAEAAYSARRAHSDVLVTVGALASLDAWVRWRDDRRTCWAALGALSLGVLLWSKHEGTAIAAATAAAAVLLALLHRLRREGGTGAWSPRGALVLLPPLFVLAVTWAVNASNDAGNMFVENKLSGKTDTVDFEGNLLTVFFERFPERFLPVMRYFGANVFFAPRHSWFTLALFVLLLPIAARWGRREELRVSAAALGLGLAGLVLVFIGLPLDIHWHLKTAASRVGFHLAPAITLWVGLALTDLLDERSPAPRAIGRGLLLVLVVCAAPAAWNGARPLLTRTPATLRQAFTDGEAERVDRRLGRIAAARGLSKDFARDVFRAVDEHVPPQETVLVGVPHGEMPQYVHALRNLAFPRKIVPQQIPDDPGASEALHELRGKMWCLDLVGHPERFEGHFELVASGPGWALWR
jgi:hypothetical protein